MGYFIRYTMSSIIKYYFGFVYINCCNLSNPIDFCTNIIQCCIGYIVNIFVGQTQCMLTVFSECRSIVLRKFYNLFTLIFFIGNDYGKSILPYLLLWGESLYFIQQMFSVKLYIIT